MREILFRGKCIENGEWVYGAYGSHTPLEAMIINKPYPASDGGLSAIGFWEVRPNTVGQYTGLTDRNGAMIFEGDICEIDREDGRFEIIWDNREARFALVSDELYFDFDHFYLNEIMVIGNIYDTPELLGVKK